MILLSISPFIFIQCGSGGAGGGGGEGGGGGSAVRPFRSI